MSNPPFRLYNTLTQSLETFVPQKPGAVSLYVCGLTPYAHAHAGHGRCNVAFDVLARYLRARGYDVTHVRNVTDIDDKILKRARELGEDPLAFSARMTEVNLAELRACGCGAPDHEPKVSQTIPEIVALIERLVERGAAYPAQTATGTDVYFSVRSFPEYGKLSHRNIDDLLSGARVEVEDCKRDPLDFALWKGSDADTWGWDSPWGRGRPGWHIECSAMALKFLGQPIDIHCGGMDLVFPHHENEIAQSEAASGSLYVRYWMHNGFLTVDAEKMSKSLGNFVTIKDVLDRNDPEAFRYFLLGTHYRGPLNFDVEKTEDGRVLFPGVDEAERRTDYLYATREALLLAADGAAPSDATGKTLAPQAKIIAEAEERVLQALDRDLNTPQALSVIADLAKAANEVAMQTPRLRKDPKAHGEARALAARAVEVIGRATAPLGLLQAPSGEYAARTRRRRLQLRNLDEATIEAKVVARNEARASKDFAKADALRAELEALNVEIFDGAMDTTWRLRA